MKNECNCGGEAVQTLKPLTTISGEQLSQLATLSGMSLLQLSNSPSLSARFTPGSLSGSGGVQTHFHLTDEGDALATTSTVEGSTGGIVVRGTIAGIPYELHLRVSLESEQVVVTLHLTRPIEIGPYTWRFELGGVVKDSAGKVVSAASITPSAEAQAMGINWWCAVKCGGATILPTLVLCLPAFAGGPAAYVACVTGKLGAGSAAAIAACIAKKCL